MSNRLRLISLALVVLALVIPGARISTEQGAGLATAGAQGPAFFGAQRFPAIAVDKDDKVYMVSSTATKPAGAGTPGSQIFFTMSKDGGASWDNLPKTRNLSKSRGEAFGPSLAINKVGKTRVYITYHDNSNGTTQAYLIKSKKGTKFKAPKNVTPHGGGAFSPRVALGENESVNIVWGDTFETARKIKFIRSTDQGETFGEPVEVTHSSGDAFEPEISIDKDDAINIAWEDTRSGVSAIMFARSTDQGATFSDAKRVSAGEGRAAEAHIATDGEGNIHIAWVDESNGDAQAFYARSTDRGETFSAPIDVSRDPGARVLKPVITTFGSRVYLAYQDEKPGNKQVFLARSENGGVEFSNPVQVSRADNSVPGGRAHSVAMAVDSKGKLHIAWIDSSVIGRDEGLLFYSNSTNGRSFTTQTAVISAI
ncbi:MAG TPA: sialidase family protein [Blastocatellia bacterium]|jgi:hypothetical protein|nr:sialidase family protein [Blastocatellia bacterium]